MSHAPHTIDLLAAAAADDAPTRTSPASLHLVRLNLHVTVRELQSMEGAGMAVFISEFDAATRSGAPGITITCVGIAGSIPAAAGDAVGQWMLGVHPVLAAWRGGHSCVVDARPVELCGGRFDLLASPLMVRGHPGEEQPDPAALQSLFDLVQPPLAEMRLTRRIHWLELFTSQSEDGTVNATCRLNNRDWRPGQQVLARLAVGWPPSGKPIHSWRQFALLTPEGGEGEELRPATWWGRVRGRE